MIEELPVFGPVELSTVALRLMGPPATSEIDPSELIVAEPLPVMPPLAADMDIPDPVLAAMWLVIGPVSETP
jgi:hypothetical protein